MAQGVPLCLYYIGVVVRPAPIPVTSAPALTGPLAPGRPLPPGHPRRRIIGRQPPSRLGDVGPSPESPSARPPLPAPCSSACPAPPLPVPSSSACPAPRTSPPQPCLVHIAAPAPQQRSCRGCTDAMQIPGIIHRSDLRTVGIDEAARRRFLRRGLMQRVDCWYVRSTAPANLVALLEQGVRPTCVNAARHHGLWIPLHAGEHVYRPRVLPESGRPTSLVLHGSEMRSWPDRDPVAELELALEHAGRCLPVRDAAIPV